jgi:POLQ-like helicase
MSPLAVALNFRIEEYSGGKGTLPPRKRPNRNAIFICTIEKALMLFDSLVENSRENEIGLVVVDELHMIGEQRRGAILEMFLSKIMHFKAIQIVGMSATIGNLTEIARFINADIYEGDFRPVELRELVKYGNDIVEINKNAQRMDEIFMAKTSVEYECSAEQKRNDPDHIVSLVAEVIPRASCLVFCATKQNCENVYLLLAKHLPKELHQHRNDEKRLLYGQQKHWSWNSLWCCVSSFRTDC